MTTSPDMSNCPAALALPAGVLYVIIVGLGLGSELLIRQPLIVAGDPAATAAAIRSAPGLFRAAIAADATMVAADIALALLLYLLLRTAGPVLALFATVFRLAQAAILAGNLLHLQAALLLLTGTEAPPEAALLAAQALALHAHGYDLGLFYFGIATVLTGLLVARGPLFGRWLAVLLAAAGAVYLTGSGLRFLAPGAFDIFTPAYAIPIVAETAFALALIRFGLSEHARRRAGGRG